MPSTSNFDGCSVLTLESRRSKEMAALVSTFGGVPMSAPALREVALEANVAAVEFASALERGAFDLVVLLTGVGTRELVAAVEPTCSREAFAAALSRTKTLARGPKPVAALRELQVTPWAVAPEPNTWKEVIGTLDARAPELSLRGARVAVQEYGVPNTELLAALETRGAIVTSVPVYRWALPEDLEPLRTAVRAIARAEVDVVLFTTGVQLSHLWHVVDELHLDQDVRRGLSGAILASIGPTTSEELRRRGLPVDLEASHPKMGLLVREAAERFAQLKRAKRATGG